MAGIDFDRAPLRRGWVLAAARASVFAVSGGSAAVARPDRANRALVHRWRDRLVALRDAGWPPAQGRGLGFLWNCPPCGVKGSGMVLRLCGLRPCPWCHMRRVVTALVRISRLQAELGERGRRPLILARVATPVLPPEDLDVAVNSLGAGRLPMVRSRPNIGCVSYAHLDVVDAAGSCRGCRNLLYLPLSAVTPGADGAKDAREVGYRPADLVGVAPLAFPYPAWCLDGPAELAVRLLAALKRRPAFTFYNALYHAPESAGRAGVVVADGPEE